jgi:hypothetical protein
MNRNVTKSVASARRSRAIAAGTATLVVATRLDDVITTP